MIFEKQEYQEKCVSNIVSILDKMDNFFDNNFDKEELKLALEEHYKENNYNTNNFPIIIRNGIDVLMETGTGKTFCYLKTIFELNKQFNKTRFIIVVPRTSIRSGVKQAIRQTASYFQTEYKKQLSVIEVNEAKRDIPKIENQFLNDDNSIQVLLLTNSAVNSEKNNMNKLPEKGSLFINGSVWENIANISPVVILDEPHMLTGDATKKALNKLKNSFIIRFGATYPTDDENNLSNLAYSLDSISAFNQFLVKRIRVNTILKNDTEENYKIANIESNKQQFTLSYFINGEHNSKTVKVKQDIGGLTGIESLQGIQANKINASKVYLSNKKILELNSGFEIDEEETKIMIQQTIEKHFQKEEELFKKGVKSLSLFFIPSIDSFRGDNPIIKNIFEEEYKKIRDKFYDKTKNKKYKEYLDKDFNDEGLFVHQGYFSGDKGSSEEKERKGVSEILNDKEALLSLEGDMGNLRFIFSVWALQEGWDNPNVMSICKLTNTTKDISRRQQVGRGLRISVNQKGQRLTHNYLNDDEQGTLFYGINTLDMFVSHYELDFIDNIQNEIQSSSYGILNNIITMEILKDIGLSDSSVSRFIISLEDNEIVFKNENNELEIKSPVIDFIRANKDNLTFLLDTEFNSLEMAFSMDNQQKIIDGNKKIKKVQIRSDKLEEFKQLWETINKKSQIVYNNLNEQNIIEIVVDKFNAESVDPIRISVVEKEYDTQNDVIKTKSTKPIESETDYKKHFKYNDFISDVLNETNLPLQFVIKLFNKLDIEKIASNPKKSKYRLIEIIKETIHSNIIQSVAYQFDAETVITDTKLHEDGQYLSEISYKSLGRYISDKEPMDELLYDTIIYDSNIEELSQASDASKYGDDKITVFAKLPSISIPTPYKAYNPDFAYLIENETGKKLFLIIETKGYDSFDKIDAKEQKKIDYGKKFFEALQNELPDIEIRFETRINTKDLTQILNDIRQGKAV